MGLEIACPNEEMDLFAKFKQFHSGNGDCFNRALKLKVGAQF